MRPLSGEAWPGWLRWGGGGCNACARAQTIWRPCAERLCLCVSASGVLTETATVAARPGTWPTACSGRAQGLVQAVGVSNYGPRQLERIHAYLERRGVPLASAQARPQAALVSTGTFT